VSLSPELPEELKRRIAAMKAGRPLQPMSKPIETPFTKQSKGK
jgi:hypothetical protein